MNYLRKLLLATVLLWPAYSGAVTYDFICQTKNNLSDCATAEAYLGMEVLETTLGASFTFTNIGTERTNIKTIWFDDDDGILDISSALKDESDGVSFTDLEPSTQNVGGLGFVAEGKAKRDGNADDGVTSGPTALADPEYVSFDIALTGSNTFALLLNALNERTLDVGIHVISFASGGSEKLSLVPVPAAFWLFGTALIGFVGISRRTKV